MKIGKNIYYYEGRKRQKYSFEKSIEGRRISRRFERRQDAEEFAKKFNLALYEHGSKSVIIDPEEREKLKEIKKLCGGFDPVDAVKFWRQHHTEDLVNAPDLETCFGEFFTWLEKSGRSEAHIRSLKTTRKHFLGRFHGRRLESIRKQDLLDWILSEKDLSPRSKKNLWTNTHNFLSWCQNAKNWLLNVPKIDDRLLPKETKKPVTIWTADETEQAFRWLEKNAPECVPYFALRAFAGLRTLEARRMRWEWIDFKNHRITVPAEICKTRDAWVILPEFCPRTVFAWLAPWRKHEGQMHVPCGKLQSRITNALPWKPNVLRHTFATMHVAFYHDEGKTILATRHTNITTLRANYRGVNQTSADAKKYFALRPSKIAR